MIAKFIAFPLFPVPGAVTSGAFLCCAEGLRPAFRLESTSFCGGSIRRFPKRLLCSAAAATPSVWWVGNWMTHVPPCPGGSRRDGTRVCLQVGNTSLGMACRLKINLSYGFIQLVKPQLA